MNSSSNQVRQKGTAVCTTFEIEKFSTSNTGKDLASFPSVKLFGTNEFW